MAWFFAQLVSLAKLHNTVDLNSDITCITVYDTRKGGEALMQTIISKGIDTKNISTVT